MSPRLESVDEQGQKWTTPYPNAEQRAALRANRSASRASRISNASCRQSASPPQDDLVPAPTSAPPPSPPSNHPNLSLDSEQDFPSLPRTPTASPTPEAQASRFRVSTLGETAANPESSNAPPSLSETVEGPEVTSPAPTPTPPAPWDVPAENARTSHTPLITTPVLAAFPMHSAAPDIDPHGSVQAGPSSHTLDHAPGQPMLPPSETPAPDHRLSPPLMHARKRHRTASNPSTIVIDLAAANGHVESPRPTIARSRSILELSDDDGMSIDPSSDVSRPPSAAWPTPPTPPRDAFPRLLRLPPPPADLPLPPQSPPPYRAREVVPTTLAPAFRQHSIAAKIYTSSPWQAWLRLNPAQERFWQRSLAPGQPGSVLFALEYSRSETSGSSSTDRISAELSAALRRPDNNLVAVSYPHAVLTPSGTRARQSVWHFVYNLTMAEHKALLHARAISRDSRAYIFLPARLDISQPVFLYALQGLRGSLDDLVPHFRRCIQESSAYQELRNAHYGHPRMADFIANLRFNRLAMRDSNGRPIQTIRVYAHLPTDDPTEQQAARDSLRSVNFDHLFLGAAHKESYLCNHCQSSDHPSGLCPLPNIHGWQGPNPNKPINGGPDPIDLPPAILPAIPQSLLSNPERDRGRDRNRGRGGGRGRTTTNGNGGDNFANRG
ncbi:hypothetical protein K488DRAFT_90368 [Vararia minispora EC-137]|uniref:Uncharacterized protein n=1 Tax=Vararia minispora EC-137 TaxID=1314806 RepID=A0ACB8Q7V5_9AGAM|nr:hypothetical protein K488DRAFT_90368 [Vararia minispora EC-137]